MYDVHLLAAGISAILGVEVVHPDRGPDLPKLSIHDLFHLTYLPIPQDSLTEGELFQVHAKTLTGHKITVSVTGSFTIAHVKAAIEEKEGTPAREIRLVFNSKVLEDEDTVQSSGILPESTLYLILKGHSPGPEYQLDLSELAPSFDYDFTQVQDDGKKYMRGKFKYRRPYGWYRYALNVVGKYENDKWLGGGGIRTASTRDEWPVSYHGTNMKDAKSVTGGGHLVSDGFKTGKGVCSSPEVSVAKEFSPRFQYQGRYYRIVLQSRVNPSEGHLVVLSGGRYWICPKHDSAKKVFDIRPYAILLSKPE